MRLVNSFKFSLLLSTLVLLTACGGGADGGTRNLAPTITNTSPDTIDERTEATLSITASDPDGSIRQYRWLQNDGPRVSFNDGRSSITFEVPEVEEDTTARFSVDVVDDFGAISSLDIVVTFRNVNRAPVADTQQLTVDENSSIEFNLTASDLDGDTLSFSITEQPSAGSLALVDGDTQLYRYTPNQDSVADDQITFSASDSELSDSATISFDVVPVTTKALRITAFALANHWDDTRWVEISNKGTTSINLKAYTIRTEKLSAIQFKPQGYYDIQLPNLLLEPGQLKTLVFGINGLDTVNLTSPSQPYYIFLA
ncbi:MAG: hypothetical protein KJO69_11185, partial [Gammaproteobacteria bacterium]|nr:hypothetical protein [Gammaproteobacteria bacterium]